MVSIHCLNCGRVFDTGAYYNTTNELMPVRCVNCGSLMLIQLKDGYVTSQKPYIPFEIKLQKAKVPPDILSDFEEATTCLGMRCLRASVVMARRALQNACTQIGANPKDELIKQIKWLFDNNKINDRVYNQATTVRQFGNYGAHPQDDGLDKFLDDEAEDIVRICERILRDLFH